jgi:2-polyprenyl-3-methyl-5-hydroxy-6-metoxy-1,4-benzoquinol methylase
VSYASIDVLRSQLGGAPSSAHSPEYIEKMMHPFPPATQVDRAKFILEHCTGKRVLEFGASGTLSAQIRAVASEYFGVDRQSNKDANIQGFDLDDVSKDYLPFWSQTEFVRLDVIVCGEVLEHLSNPGHFLRRLRHQYAENEQHKGIAFIMTVPNAFAKAGAQWAAKGIENVNRDHVAWYSPKTISVLLERAGFTVGGLFWYGGDGPTAEGLVVVTE